MTQRTADRIQKSLENAILIGEFHDGERLDENALAKQFKVSRTPIREALVQLSASGLVELKKNRGAFVRFPGVPELVEMFEVMAELEAMCARLAARRISDDELIKLTTAMKACEQAMLAGDFDNYYLINEQFHRHIYMASGNTFLAEQAIRLHKRLQAFRRLQLRVRGRLTQSMQEHRDILDAIRRGDVAMSASQMRDHVAIQGVKFNDLIANYQRHITPRNRDQSGEIIAFQTSEQKTN